MWSYNCVSFKNQEIWNIKNLVLKNLFRDESVKEEELQKIEAENVTVVSLEFSLMMEVIPMCEKLADMEEDEIIKFNFENIFKDIWNQSQA